VGREPPAVAVVVERPQAEEVELVAAVARIRVVAAVASAYP